VISSLQLHPILQPSGDAERLDKCKELVTALHGGAEMDRLFTRNLVANDESPCATKIRPVDEHAFDAPIPLFGSGSVNGGATNLV
jgi:hypothetical protein